MTGHGTPRATDRAARGARTRARQGLAGARHGRNNPGMTGPARRRPRVLLANLEPIARVGMGELLAGDGIDVVIATPATIITRAAQDEPDAVVLGRDDAESWEISRCVRRVAPAAKVILWSRDEDVMEVLDPGPTGRRRTCSAMPDALLSEVNTTPNPGEE